MFNVYKPGIATAGTLLPRITGGLTRITESFLVDKAIPKKKLDELDENYDVVRWTQIDH